MTSNLRVLLAHPLAIHTSNDQDARDGLVVHGGKIVELVALLLCGARRADAVMVGGGW
ncbi:hypothetical protein ADIMK_3960 [Marinobacterium lacunae]|uniref:Uncharacterized protein n=1 Tax=Marinobacterium lacunae TaxID=1232683 RepID=A0A081FTF8_9GAMM|nr:hypothetical protein [Marinobacterium lacunae]KEA61813.1 hypothetical protein ADIMK_3960 [Marinobacterium lacunae]